MLVLHVTRALLAAIATDSKTALCEPWCARNDEHEKFCKCRSCSWSRDRLETGAKCVYLEANKNCHSEQPNDTPFEGCSRWCSPLYIDAHCGKMCACKACTFCREALEQRVPCKSFAPRGDTDYEKCDSFCDPRYAQVHCSICRCRGCDWCDGIEICDPTQPGSA